MKCDTCTQKMLSSIQVFYTFDMEEKTYTVYNVPVWYCDKCRKEVIDKSTEENLRRYCKKVTGTVVNYSKMKADEDAASVAASMGMM